MFGQNAPGAGGRFAAAGDPVIQQIAAAADYIGNGATGNGALYVNMYEREIMDYVRRSSIFRQRIREIPATGHPHRYFEQTAIGEGTFTNARNLSPTPSGPTRVERSVMIKALINQANLNIFDVQVTQQQGLFNGLEAKDIEDCINGIVRTAARAYWNGSDTSLSTPTTEEYVGVLTQITLQFTCAPGSSIIDSFKRAVATMMTSTDFDVRPTAIYLNPLLGDYIDQEAKAQHVTLTTTVVGGVSVSEIATQAGRLPLIPDVWMPTETGAKYGFSAPPAGMKNYFAVITTEREIERPYIDGGRGNPNPQMYRLGLPSALTGQYVAVQFDAVLVRGPDYNHSVVCVQRP